MDIYNVELTAATVLIGHSHFYGSLIHLSFSALISSIQLKGGAPNEVMNSLPVHSSLNALPSPFAASLIR